MSVSPSFRSYVLEQLSRGRTDIRARAMFGGVGIYAGDLFFALVDDDVLYLKVDETTRARYTGRGLSPFMPGGEGGEVMQYYQVPEDALEDVEELGRWMEEAIEVARRRRKKPGRRR